MASQLRLALCSQSFGAGRESVVLESSPHLKERKEIHRVFETNNLMQMYIKRGSMADARHVFDCMPMRNAVSWNIMIMGYAKEEEGARALDLYGRMLQQGLHPNDRTIIGAMKACAGLAALEEGKEVDGQVAKKVCLEKGKAIHSQAVKNGIELGVYVGNSLLNMYLKCGSMDDAWGVFEELPCRDVVSWTTMILGHAEKEEGLLALELCARMHQEGVQPAARTYAGTLKACSILAVLEEGKQLDGKDVKIGCLAKGRAIHSLVVKSGFESDIFVGTTLVHVYAKCGSMEDARQVFNELPHRNVVTWNTMIIGYAEQEETVPALALYAQIHKEGIQPDPHTSVGALKACSTLAAALESGKPVDRKFGKIRCLAIGRTIHFQVIRSGFESDPFVGTILVNMYAKCWSMEDAQRVFLELPHDNVVLWTTMILGYVEQGDSMMALKLYAQMHNEGVPPDPRAFVASLKACSGLAALEERKQVDWKFWTILCLVKGRALHSQVINSGFELDAFVGNTLVNMYVRCRSMEDAWYVFDVLLRRGVVTWNTMIEGYAEQGVLALDLYAQMQKEGVQPDSWTFVGTLKACISLAALEEEDGKFVRVKSLVKGSAIYSHIVKGGFESDLFVGATIVDFYVNCSSMKDAWCVFDRLPHRDVVTWTNIISGYAEQEDCALAIELYAQMHQEGVQPDAQTFAGALKACSILAASLEGNGWKSEKIGCLTRGRAIHAQIMNSGCESDVFVGNTLVYMYAKCGIMEDAQRVFDELPDRNVVTWTNLILGYAEQEEKEKAFRVYVQMQEQGLSPNSVTFVAILKACGNTASLKTGEDLHLQISSVGFETIVAVATSLIDMYAKCGSMVDAQKLFDALPTRDVAAWSALISGYARQGENELVFHLFETMRQEGNVPNGLTFLSVLTVCSHAGLVDKGQEYFQAMSKQYDISPTIEHYTTMVDILGRAGRVDEALIMVDELPFQPDVVVWMTLLGACQKWKNVEVGRHAFEKVVRLDKKHPAAFVLMANIYADAQMWEDYEMIEVMQRNAQTWKEATAGRLILGGMRKQLWKNVEVGRHAFEKLVRLDKNTLLHMS